MRDIPEGAVSEFWAGASLRERAGFAGGLLLASSGFFGSGLSASGLVHEGPTTRAVASTAVSALGAVIGVRLARDEIDEIVAHRRPPRPTPPPAPPAVHRPV